MKYVREDIIIDFPVPKILENTMQDAKDADDREDGTYDEWADTLDNICKACCADGLITQKQWERINEKFPFAMW